LEKYTKGGSTINFLNDLIMGIKSWIENPDLMAEKSNLELSNRVIKLFEEMSDAYDKEIIERSCILRCSRGRVFSNLA